MYTHGKVEKNITRNASFPFSIKAPYYGAFILSNEERVEMYTFPQRLSEDTTKVSFILSNNLNYYICYQ